MRRAPLILTLSLVTAGTMLGGCSLLSSGPTRDSQGQVTESATLSARELLVGDCFTFNSADGSVVSEVTVVPCADDHVYTVLDQGALSTAEVTSAGSLQNAVSVACSAPFAAFKEANTSDTKPKQEFLVFPETDEADADQLYSCIATDPAVPVQAETPETPASETPAP